MLENFIENGILEKNAIAEIKKDFVIPAIVQNLKNVDFDEQKNFTDVYYIFNKVITFKITYPKLPDQKINRKNLFFKIPDVKFPGTYQIISL